MKGLVVGAGPAVAATALLLARCGVDVKLVERERSFARVFRGEGLMPYSRWGSGKFSRPYRDASASHLR